MYNFQCHVLLYLSNILFWRYNYSDSLKFVVNSSCFHDKDRYNFLSPSHIYHKFEPASASFPQILIFTIKNFPKILSGHFVFMISHMWGSAAQQQPVFAALGIGLDTQKQNMYQPTLPNPSSPWQPWCKEPNIFNLLHTLLFFHIFPPINVWIQIFSHTWGDT